MRPEFGYSPRPVQYGRPAGPKNTEQGRGGGGVKPDLIPEILILGVIVAGLYGLLPIAIVLTYRISRSVAFIHGGIAIAGGLAYKVLVNGQDTGHDFYRHPIMAPMPALLLVTAAGALVAGLYGTLVMSRWIASFPGITLTVLSISALLMCISAGGYFLRPAPASVADSAFGEGGIRMDLVTLSHNRLATLVILIVLVIALTYYLNRTYTGLAIRAIADDVEASVWCGTKLRAIGTGVYALSGAISALAGSLFTASVAEAVDGMLLLFATGLLLAVVGGMRSVALALGGALLYGVLETALVVGFFGDLGPGARQIIQFLALFAFIAAVARYRKESFFLLERQNA
jgi:branched-chain amino acid transport system permease protein